MIVDIEFDYNVFLPAYRPMVNSDADIFCLWGGRDSGKTHFIAQKLIKECLELPYFKCVLVRKVQDTIKESQFETIKTIVQDWGLEQFFDFTTHPLEIRCKNGNKFIARGCDKIEKIKSIKDPTHAWIEEMDQISQSDHAVISTTLRSNTTKTREYWSFNPETTGDFKDNWLYKVVGESYNCRRTFVKMVEVAGKEIPVKYDTIHTTYLDNPFCPPERVAKYMEVSEGDTYQYNVWIHGWWGQRAVLRPFAHAFDKAKHVSNEIVFRPHLPIRISVDFNYEPFCAIIANQWRDQQGEHLHIFHEISISHGSIEEMAKQIRSVIGNNTNYELTGDRMGNSRRVKLKDSDNTRLYDQLRIDLRASKSQFILPRNPFHKESRHNYNFMLNNHPDFKISHKCVGLITDHLTVEVDEHGSIIKSNREKVGQKADFIDCSRYTENTFLAQWRRVHMK